MAGAVAAVAFSLSAVAAGAAPSGATAPSEARLIASPEPGWPQWRGPRRDGISDETGLLATWPDDGPKRRWQATNLGKGYSAPIVTGGRIYLAGDVGDDLKLFALDLDGRLVWTAANGCSWNGAYPGARAACTFSEGRLYHLNAHGRVACFDAADGREVWAAEIFDLFGGRNITWALSECLLVDGPRVMVTVGGSEALMVALDKRTGAVVWKTPPLKLGPSPGPSHERVVEPAGQFDNASYASPILFELGGQRHIVGCSNRHVFGVDADSGELLWTRALPTRHSVIAATPVLIGNAIFITAPDTEAAGLFRLTVADKRVGVERVWTTQLDTCHGGLVRVGDSLMGSWYRRSKGWAVLDARTGAMRSETKDLEMGSVLYADRRWYCLSQEGEMALVALTPAGFEFTGRFKLVTERKSDVWTHPVILDGCLYLRYHETLSSFDIRAR